MPIQQPAINVPFTELSGSPTEEFTDDGFSATRRLKCAWDDRFRLARQLLGGVNAHGVLRFGQPYLGDSAARVSGVRIRPFAASAIDASEGDDQRGAYAEAELTVQYTTPSAGAGQDTDKLIEEHVTISKEFLTVPGEELFQQPANGNGNGQGEPIGEPPGILIPMMAWSYTRRQLLSVPQAAATLIGHVNSATMTSPSLGLSFQPETLLYENISLRRTAGIDETPTWDVTWTLVHRPRGWNIFLLSDLTWGHVYQEGSSTPWKPYEPANLLAIGM